jgi:hypothetical protein
MSRARLSSTMAASSVRWGICGSGKICSDFCAALHSLGYPITAVAASTLEKVGGHC